MLPATVTFSQASAEQLADYDNCVLCDGDLIDPPPIPKENYRFEYRGVSANICTEKHLFHPLCVLENTTRNSAFSCTKCNVTAIPEESQLQTVRRLAGYQDESSTLPSLRTRFQNIFKSSRNGIVPSEKLVELQGLADLLDKKCQNPTDEFKKLRGEVHYILGLSFKTHVTGRNDRFFEQVFQSLQIACKTGIAAAREPFIEMLANKINFAPYSKKICLSIVDSMPEFEGKDEFVRQAKSALYLALGQSLFRECEALPLDQSIHSRSIHDALRELQKSVNLGNLSAQPIFAECSYVIAKKTYEEDTIKHYRLTKAEEHLNTAEQHGTEELKQKIAALRSNLIKFYQNKAETAVKSFKTDFPGEREYKLSDNALEDLWDRLEFAKEFGTELVKGEAQSLEARKEEFLSFNRSLPDQPAYLDPNFMW